MYGNKTLLRFYLGLDRTCMTRVMAPYSAKDDGFAFQGIQYFNSFSISVVLDFYIRSLFNGSERGHCASNTSARRDVTIDDVIIRTPDVMCEWLTRRTRYIPNFICLACKLIAL